MALIKIPKLGIENRKTFFNLLYRLSFLSIGKLIGFVTIPIISTSLGPENYGIYSFALTFASYSFLLATWGFIEKGIREVAKKNNESSETVVNRILSSRLLFWFFGLIAGVLLSIGIYGFGGLVEVLFIAMLTNLGAALMLDFYFYGKKNTLIPSVIHLIGQTTFLGGVFFFINSREDLELVLFLYGACNFLEALILIILYKKRKKLSLDLSVQKSFKLLKDNFSLGLGSKATFFQSTYPILIIPIILNQFYLGIFMVAFKFFTLTKLPPQIFNTVFSPIIVEYRLKPTKSQVQLFKRLTILYLFWGLISSIILYFVGDLLIDLLFGSEYANAKTILKYFTFFLIPLWPLYLMLTMYLNNLEMDKQFLIGSIYSLIFTVVMVPIGIKYFDLKGVIFSLAISLFFACIYYFMIIFRKVRR